MHITGTMLLQTRAGTAPHQFLQLHALPCRCICTSIMLPMLELCLSPAQHQVSVQQPLMDCPSEGGVVLKCATEGIGDMVII